MKKITAILSTLLITSTGFAAEVLSTTVCDVSRLNTGEAIAGLILGSDEGKYITEAVRALDENNDIRIRASLDDGGQRVTVRIQKGPNNPFSTKTFAVASGGIESRLALDIPEIDISVSCEKTSKHY